MNNKNKILMVVALAGAGCAQQPVQVVSGYHGGAEVEQQPRIAAARQKPQVTEIYETPMGKIEPAAGPVTPFRPASVPVQARTEPVAQRIEAVTPPVKKVELVEHRVGPMDTVYSLARQYDTSPKDILNRNGLKTTADIREGQTLLIPSHSKPSISAWEQMKQVLSEKAPEPAPKMTKTAVATTEETPAVKPAEEKVAEAAPPVSATTVAVNAKLAEIEPAAGRPPQKDGVVLVDHQVVAGETIYRISRTYDASVLDIMAANAFEQPQDLKAGTVVKVPVNQKVAVKNTADEGVTVKGKTAEEVKAAASEPEAPVQAVQAEQEIKKPEQIAGQSSEDNDAKADVVATKEEVKQPETKQEAAAEDLKIELKRGQVDPVAAKADGPVWPVKGTILKRFGDEGNGVAHTGINIAVPNGTPVLAIEDGTVLYADEGLKTYGKMVLLRHANGMVSAYAHNGHLLVRKGEKVQKGQIIATSGASGNVDTPQLHFELRRHASALDPMRELPKL